MFYLYFIALPSSDFEIGCESGSLHIEQDVSEWFLERVAEACRHRIALSSVHIHHLLL